MAISQVKDQAIENVKIILEQENIYLSLLDRERDALEIIIKEAKSLMGDAYNAEQDYQIVKKEQQLFRIKGDIIAKNGYVEKKTKLINQ